MVFLWPNNIGQLLDIISLKKEEEEWETNLKIILGKYPILFFDIWEENVRWSPDIVPPKYWKNLEISIG
jgi:hypothetical protein